MLLRLFTGTVLHTGRVYRQLIGLSLLPSETRPSLEYRGLLQKNVSIEACNIFFIPVSFKRTEKQEKIEAAACKLLRSFGEKARQSETERDREKKTYRQAYRDIDK